ncbi:glycosyltransferase [Metabacillus niabensis]|uniref:Glycosyltransferase involved in cell wall biosynthesis n=1 Tax=Metabacillus niabensis TaxID=324854 RepID=A0ABT9Z6U5_9BACI|nr:glycosyltransferase [Metabacillus niabensis]MDQ0227978.1 glycosyltransferase involved in cell wall biosynthesis [Metabacillus niabensis]
MEKIFSSILDKINNNDIMLAEETLNKFQQHLINIGDYYFFQALLNIKKENYTNAWLWSWRGKGLFPEMQEINEIYAVIDEHLYKGKNTQKEIKWKGKSIRLNLEFINKLSKATNPQVLQGSMEIANQMNTLSKGLQLLNVKAHTINYYPYYLGYQSNYEWNLIGQRSDPAINSKLRKLTKELILNYDIFHFHWGTTLTLDWSDLEILNESQKSLIMQHWGSDVRLFSEAKKLNPYALVKNHNEDDLKWRLSKLSEHIKHCVVFDEELYHYVNNFYEKTTIIPSMIDTEQYKPKIDQVKNSRPVIAHAPTSPYIKGTKHILKAIETLKEQYEFEFILVQGKSHKEAMEIYQKADLIIDQLHIGSYGLFAVEAMALGKPVICWISDFMKEKYPKELPIIIANPDTIKECIEYSLKNLDMLSEIGKKGRKYVEIHHDMITNSQMMLKKYKEILQN